MQTSKGTSPRVVIVAVFLLFFLPIVLAWALVESGWRPGGTSNHGILIQPPVPAAETVFTTSGGARLTERDFAGYWTVLIAEPGACEDECLALLEQLARVYVALNKDMDRVRIALLLPSAAEAPDLPEPFAVYRVAPETFLELAAADEQLSPTETVAYVVDPWGLRMMAYPQPIEAKGLLEDLRRLLKASDEEIERPERLVEER